MRLSKSRFFEASGCTLAVLMVIAAGVVLPTASVSAGAGLSYLGSTAWSEVTDAVIEDSLAYLAMAHGLQVIDLRNPSNPQPIGYVYLEGQPFSAIAKSGSVVCVSRWSSEHAMYVVDVTDPTSPTVVGELSAPMPAHGLDVVGSTAVVTYGPNGGYTGEMGMIICDISDPAHIVSRNLPLSLVPFAPRIRTGIAYVVAEDLTLPRFSGQNERIGLCSCPKEFVCPQRSVGSMTGSSSWKRFV